MSRLFIRVTVSLLLVLLGASAASALDYKDYIGFRQLQTELGSSIPTGKDVVVTQAEAGYWDATNLVWVYLPDRNLAQFTTKNFIPQTWAYNWSYSILTHATIVGLYFYGNTSSIAPGITSINNYLADHWLTTGFLEPGFNAQPYTTSARVANHSYVGTTATDPAVTVDTLKRLDWVINRDEYIQVVAMDNGAGPATKPVLGSSFNAIAVGRSDGNSKHGSYALDSLYTAGRTRPDLVAPMGTTSSATPVVGAAAALLVEVGHAGGTTLSTDPAKKSTTNRNGDTIYNAERSEVVKAALMAGASRNAAQLTLGYTVNTTNGLNSTYGAGQLNIYNSYHIIAAGEQNSLEDGGTGHIGSYGFDYDPYFGGSSNSNRIASYSFTASADRKVTASLVWNLDVNGGTPNNFDDSATFYNLGLYLYDITTDTDGVLVGQSVGLSDNTENLWLSVYADHNYLLQVQALTSGDFLWDYGLAWDLVPVPGTVYLLGTGFLVLVGFRRKFRS